VNAQTGCDLEGRDIDGFHILFQQINAHIGNEFSGAIDRQIVYPNQHGIRRCPFLIAWQQAGPSTPACNLVSVGTKCSTDHITNGFEDGSRPLEFSLPSVKRHFRRDKMLLKRIILSHAGSKSMHSARSAC